MFVCDLRAIRHTDLWIALEKNSVWGIKKRKQTTEAKRWNPVSKSLNKHWLWKWIPAKMCRKSRERRETSGPDYSTRWQQDVSSLRLVSASSDLLYLPIQDTLHFSQHLSVAVFFLFFFASALSFSVSVFSGSWPGLLLIPWRCLQLCSASSCSFRKKVIREGSSSSQTRPVVVLLPGDGDDRSVTWTRPHGLTYPLFALAYLQLRRPDKDTKSQCDVMTKSKILSSGLETGFPFVTGVTTKLKPDYVDGGIGNFKEAFWKISSHMIGFMGITAQSQTGT